MTDLDHKRRRFRDPSPLSQIEVLVSNILIKVRRNFLTIDIAKKKKNYLSYRDARSLKIDF